MPQIIRKERTAHLVSTLPLQEMLINIKTRQPPLIPFSQNTYHELPSSFEYCKVFKNSLEHLQKQSFADVLHS